MVIILKLKLIKPDMRGTLEPLSLNTLYATSKADFHFKRVNYSSRSKLLCLCAYLLTY